jgi:hypothetical protein
MLRNFTLPELVTGARVSRDIARRYLRGLLAGGHVQRTNETRKRDKFSARDAIVYVLARDCGVHAPHITGTGRSTRYGRAREQLWRGMKIVREFDHIELAIVASTDDVRISRVHAYDYIKRLRQAGYLRLAQPACSGSKTAPPRAARYLLIEQRWTGPIPPQIKRREHSVYDPNLGRIVTADYWMQRHAAR